MNKAEGKTLLEYSLSATSEVHLLEHLKQLKCNKMIMLLYVRIPSII